MRVDIYLGYALVSSGTCQLNNRYDVSQADCETAATALDLNDNSAEEDYNAGYPPGCYLWNSALYFNTAVSSVRCSDESNCVCGAVATGGVIPSTVISH